MHLLDDSQPHDHDPHVVGQISAWVTEHLGGLTSGSFTARVLPFGRDAAASIVLVDNSGTRHFELSLDAASAEVGVGHA